MFLVIVCVLFTMGLLCSKKVEASYSNAYDFFARYGSSMVFEPGATGEGEIYYATRGKSSNASVKYVNLGWKVSIRDGAGYNIDTIYYQLGGNYMSRVEQRTVDGYVYTLYKASLANLRSRMSATARAALQNGNCNIIFDACMTTKINNAYKGGMTDDGPSWGTVYTTYDGIANAQDWTSASKETLKTYFNKEVVGLFYNVTLNAGPGIASVSGGGRYCYGTVITISANVSNGYVFHTWVGPVVTTQSSFLYQVLNYDVAFTASANQVFVKVNFYSGMETGSGPTEVVYYTYNTSGQAFVNFGWQKTGYTQAGWSRTKGAIAAEYSVTDGISQAWLEASYPEVNLYAVWEPNTYTIIFDPNDGEGSRDSVELQYTDQLSLSPDGFTKSEGNFVGWGHSKSSSDYDAYDIVDVATLAITKNVQNKNHAIIRLYAIWGACPVIEANWIYVTLEDAKSGRITEQWLTGQVTASDKEDGMIPYGKNETNSFLITNYLATDFTEFENDGYVTETFRAIDSDGNVKEKNVRIYIVDTTMYDYDEAFRKSRFISKKYYKDDDGEFIEMGNGGLSPLSIWRCDEAYSTLLDSLFGLKESN